MRATLAAMGSGGWAGAVRRGGIAVAAAWTVACDTATAPPPAEPAVIVRIAPATPHYLAGEVGTEVIPAPAVQATTPGGMPAAGIAIAFVVAGGGFVANTSVTTDANGLASAGTWMLGAAAGTQTVTARAAGLADVVFTVAATAGPIARITRLSGHNQIAAVRQTLPQLLRVQVTDSFQNPLEGVPVSFTVMAGDGSIDDRPAVTDARGVAASGFWLLGSETGFQQVLAESDTLSVAFAAFATAPSPGMSGQVAFVSDRDGNDEIYTVNADGTGLKRLTTNRGSDLEPAWSPDGSRIAFASDGDGARGIHVMAADGSNVTRRTAGPYDGTPAWFPTGSAIAFSTLREGSSQIATVSSTDGAVMLLSADPGWESQPSWSPDGRLLAFVSDRLAHSFVYNIYTMNADGTGQALRTQGFGFWPNVSYFLHPAWSPDGTMIAYVYGSIINNDDMRFRVAVMSAEGGFLKDLAWAGDIPWLDLLDPGSLSWSPDGRGIAYTFVDCGLVHRLGCSKVRSVNVVRLDGSQQSRMVTNAHSPSWRP